MEILSFFLKENVDVFAWKLTNNPDIDPNLFCLNLAVNPSVKLVCQGKRKMDPKQLEEIEIQVKEL